MDGPDHEPELDAGGSAAAKYISLCDRARGAPFRLMDKELQVHTRAPRFGGAINWAPLAVELALLPVASRLLRGRLRTGGGATRFIARRALGAAAVGATAIGAFSVGALAVGALSIGAFAIGRLLIRRVAIRELRVGSLTIGQLHAPAAT